MNLLDSEERSEILNITNKANYYLNIAKKIYKKILQ